MSRASNHPAVFIRSVATRGCLGGVARATHEFVCVLDAVGYDPIIVETVGIGQSEVDIWRIAHTPVVVEAPGLGDAVQAMKAGVLEIASILCINKGDTPGVEAKLVQLMELAGLASQHTPGWEIQVVTTIAQTGKGIAELAESIVAHRTFLRTTDRLRLLDHARALVEIRAALESEFVDLTLMKAARVGVLDRLASMVATRKMTAADAGRELEADFLNGRRDVDWCMTDQLHLSRKIERASVLGEGQMRHLMMLACLFDVAQDPVQSISRNKVTLDQVMLSARRWRFELACINETTLSNSAAPGSCCSSRWRRLNSIVESGSCSKVRCDRRHEMNRRRTARPEASRCPPQGASTTRQGLVQRFTIGSAKHLR